MVGGLELLSLSSGFAVDTHAEFHLVLADLESGRARRGHRAGSERETERTDIVDDFLRNRFDLGERTAFFGACARDLVHEYGARHAAPADSVETVFDGDVVVNVHRVDLYALVFGKSRRVIEVHAVAGIVLDYHQRALLRRGKFQGVIDLYLRGRGEYVAAYGGV